MVADCEGRPLSEAEHLMTRIEEFLNDGRADEACSTCDKDTHVILLNAAGAAVRR